MASQPPPANQASLDASIKSAWQQTTDIAERYKAAENATRPFAKLMIDITEELTMLKVTPVTIFDLGCGTGAVEAELHAAVPKEQWKDLDILAGDVSPPMLEYLSNRAKEEGWSGVSTKVVDGGKLEDVSEHAGEGFAHIFVGFAIFVLPPETLGKLAKMVKSGGTLAISTWAQLPWFELLEETYGRIEDGPQVPTHEQLYKTMMNGLPWQDAEFVREQLKSVGLKEVKVVQEKVNVDCGTPDNYMTTMGFVLGLLSQQWPEEKREGWLKEVRETMRKVVVEKVGGEEGHLFQVFEGIVGVGLK